MLPYASYLRVYEPLAALSEAARAAIGDDVESSSDGTATLVDEQTTVLQRAMTSSTISLDVDKGSGTYVLQVDGHSFYCPADMPLRAWLSLTALVDSLGDANVALLFPAESLAIADANFLTWRRDHPRAVPHVRQATWSVPRTWFTLVSPAEREVYDAGGFDSLRYRARIVDARRRVSRTLAVLEKVLDEAELLEELQELAEWLQAFSPASWVEVDYAGVARCFGPELADDHSADDIRNALRALRDGDWGAAGEAYRGFESRWRVINSFERAN